MRISRSIPTKNLKRRILCMVTMAALTASGCAMDEASDASEEAQSGEADTLALQAPPVQDVPDPNGMYFAEVTANGTGCPRGTWDANVSPDGKVFGLSFSEYIISVDEKTQLALKDCTLSIKLRSPAGLSYTITDFYYEGYAVLQEGVMGRQTASYYFQGMPTLATEKRTDLVGPVDDPYIFQDAVDLVDAVWSPCGVERLLNIKTVLRLMNGSPRRSGIMNMAAVSGEVHPQIRFKLNYRKCATATPAPTPTKPTPTPTQPPTGGNNGRGNNGRGGRR